ncbi:MAG: hypothetical protein EA400_03715 [Chromatiaceae bacterium]|nr:MAG: hypothetical protein EA400_03715 [Chromatiaceae bacterium]
MARAYMAQQGSIIPTLFVGLGGIGSRIVDRIAARARDLPNWDSQLAGLNDFISIDTNEVDQNQLTQIPPGNRINIAAFDKARVVEHLRHARDLQTGDWLDESYQPRPGFKPGAGQIRLESRLGFFYHSPEIRRRLDERIGAMLRPNNTWRQQRPPKIHVYLFCSLAGGTGSGSFLSAAYLLDAVIRERQWQPRLIANLLLSTLLTDQVGPELHADIHANTYAALKELEYLTKLDYDQVKQSGRTFDTFVYVRDEHGDTVPQVTQRPFFMTFIMDRPPHLGLRNAELAIADAAWLQVFTPIIDNLSGELDNYEKNLEGLTHFAGNLAHVGEGFSKNFGAYGAAALVLPGTDLLDYCARRFAAEAIRGQITFGTDRHDPDDERAQALAKLTVDYADPRFLKLSEQGREEAINDAFVRSVRELKRQDANEDLTDGYWYRLVEQVDAGRVTGTDEKGAEQRAETLLTTVERALAAARAQLITRVSIKDRSMYFPKESVNVYIDAIARLEEEVRIGHQLVAAEAPGLINAAEAGELVLGLKLDPIAERYLVVRLLEVCGTDWLPSAEAQFRKAERADLLSNPAVRKRLREEIYESLQRAANTRRLFNRDRDFDQVRQEAENEYNKTRGAAVRLLDAKVRLDQFRALHRWLQRRSRQFVRLATRMDALVRELAAEAERLRNGEQARVPPFALRVEVLETLTEPRRRLWDEVFDHLFVAGGRALATFDRQVLSAAITRELAPVVGADGRVREKGLEETVGDLKRALIALGQERLGPRLLGRRLSTDPQGDGLDLAAGLDLEARLVLAGTGSGETPPAAAIADYKRMKFRALSQLAGVLARVSSADAKALADGVVLNRTRQLILGLDATAAGEGAATFVRELTEILGEAGRQVKSAVWHDPRLVIVHDVELPIPLYYFPAITGEIEEAYLRVAANEQRGYHLHTDRRWERSLPNLNPRRSELGVSWALEVLAAGLLTRVIRQRDDASLTWVWAAPEAAAPPFMPLHRLLAVVLFKLGELHGREQLRARLEEQIETAATALGDERLTERRDRLRAWLDEQLVRVDLGTLQGTATKADYLDLPVIRALRTLIDDLHRLPGLGAAAPGRAAAAPTQPGTGPTPLTFD